MISAVPPLLPPIPPAPPPSTFSFQQDTDSHDRDGDGHPLLSTAVYQAIGAASMCWYPPPSDAVFDSVRAQQIGNALLAEIRRAMLHLVDEAFDAVNVASALADTAEPR